MASLTTLLETNRNKTSREPEGTDIKRRAAVYIRKSNHDETGKNKSCDQQLEMCLDVCHDKDLEVQEARIYREEEGQKGQWWWDNHLGYHPKPYRPELTRMMDDIEAGLIDVVVVWRSDRLYRDAGVCDALVKVFRARNIRLVAGHQDMDISSAAGLYTATSEAATNRRWRDVISEDIKRDHNSKARKGMFSRNPSCVGFRSRGRGSQQVECLAEELALVLRVFLLFLVGEEGRGPLGVTGIASLLMDQGVRWPKGSKGHKAKNPDKIHTSNISSVLTNCMYVGRWRHDGREYPCDRVLVPVLDAQGAPTGKHETAVPLALYEAAQEKLARIDRPGKRSLGSGHLLSGIAVCGRCGRPLQIARHAYRLVNGPNKGAPRPPRTNFECRHRRGTRPCPAGAVFALNEKVLDAWVLAELAPLLLVEIAAMRASAGQEADRQMLVDLERQIREAKLRETKKLASLVGEMDAEQFSAVATLLRAEREALERKAIPLRQRLTRAEQTLPDLTSETLSTLPRSALKEVLTRAIAWIGIGKHGIIVLTSWGAYIGAEYRKRSKDSPNEAVNGTFLCAPSLVSTLNALDVLTDQPEFIRGRRDALGRKAERLSDAELLPGMTPAQGAGEPYVLEVSLPEGFISGNAAGENDTEDFESEPKEGEK